MKKISLLLFLLICLGKVNAQLSATGEKLHFFQINLHTLNANFYEIGFVNLNQPHLGFQIKGSYRNYSYDASSSFANFNSKLSYIKPGIIFIREQGLTHTFYLGINGIIGFSTDQLTLTVNDPLLGKVTRNYYERHNYASIELEANYLVDLSKDLAISFGGFFGAKLKDASPFSTVFNGNFAGHEPITPGAGYYDAFVGCNIGLVYRIPPFNF